MSAADNNVRHQLLELGIGDFNATLVIPAMFYGPAQSDPGLTQVKVLVRGLQRTMRQMGATWIVPTGDFDASTATCLKAVGGPMWMEMPWYELTQKLLDAKKAGKRFHPPSAARGIELAGLGDDWSLSTIAMYAIGTMLGAAAWKAYSKKKGR